MTVRSVGRLVLVLYGVGLGGFGVLFLLSPASLTDMVDTVIPTAVSSMDIRAVYGGMFCGVGLFWIVCAREDGLLRAGLLSLALTMGGLVLGRTVGLADGTPNVLIVGLYAVEIVGAVVAVASLRSSAMRSSDARGSVRLSS